MNVLDLKASRTFQTLQNGYCSISQAPVEQSSPKLHHLSTFGHTLHYSKDRGHMTSIEAHGGQSSRQTFLAKLTSNID